jgi:hypothetical protein
VPSVPGSSTKSTSELAWEAAWLSCPGTPAYTTNLRGL